MPFPRIPMGELLSKRWMIPGKQKIHLQGSIPMHPSTCATVLSKSRSLMGEVMKR